jgi:hypothetical protein
MFDDIAHHNHINDNNHHYKYMLDGIEIRLFA